MSPPRSYKVPAVPTSSARARALTHTYSRTEKGRVKTYPRTRIRRAHARPFGYISRAALIPAHIQSHPLIPARSRRKKGKDGKARGPNRSAIPSSCRARVHRSLSLSLSPLPPTSPLPLFFLPLSFCLSFSLTHIYACKSRVPSNTRGTPHHSAAVAVAAAAIAACWLECILSASKCEDRTVKSLKSNFHERVFNSALPPPPSPGLHTVYSIFFTGESCVTYTK